MPHFLGFCLESLIIDNATLGQYLPCVRGIEVNETTLDMQVKKNVCIGGPGHCLRHDQTISLMQTEYVYPEIGDRSSPKEWEELNKPRLLEIAIKRKKEILDNFHPTQLSAELDADLRGKFRILFGAYGHRICASFNCGRVLRHQACCRFADALVWSLPGG